MRSSKLPADGDGAGGKDFPFLPNLFKVSFFLRRHCDGPQRESLQSSRAPRPRLLADLFTLLFFHSVISRNTIFLHSTRASFSVVCAIGRECAFIMSPLSTTMETHNGPYQITRPGFIFLSAHSAFAARRLHDARAFHQADCSASCERFYRRRECCVVINGGFLSERRKQSEKLFGEEFVTRR